MGGREGGRVSTWWFWNAGPIIIIAVEVEAFLIAFALGIARHSRPRHQKCARACRDRGGDELGRLFVVVAVSHVRFVMWKAEARKPLDGLRRFKREEVKSISFCAAKPGTTQMKSYQYVIALV